MTKATFCPHLIINIKMTNPADVEDNYILPLCSFLHYIEEKGVPCYFPREIFVNFQHAFPWDLAHDEIWSENLNLWHTALIQKLNRINLEDITLTQQVQPAVKRCNGVTQLHENIFEEFLNNFGSKSLAGAKNEESIFSPPPICCKYEDYIQISCEEDYIKSIHSWYKLYPLDLPHKGDKPFIPPSHWKGMVKIKHGQQGGFLDKDGREWVWDKMHNDHWDVQMKKPVTGKYDKVTPEGSFMKK